MILAKNYADSEMKYFPEHFDENTRNLVRFMILEAYQSGYNTGYELGKKKKE